MKQNFIPILDNGHGIETAGKRSPVWDDGTQLFEWEFNRDIVKRVSSMLEEEGIQYRILVPETKDVSLSARCKRANAIYSEPPVIASYKRTRKRRRWHRLGGLYVRRPNKSRFDSNGTI